MRLAQIKTAGRRAFTLIELLVVIAIIAILIGLISAATMKALAKGNQTRNLDEIHQLANAIAAFKEKYKVDYIPSRIVLSETGIYPPAIPAQWALDSTIYLKQVWPKLVYPVDWNGDGVKNGPWILEGDQCLAFFLGGNAFDGAGNLVGVTGFSTNPTTPMGLGGDRVGPFYEFKTERLKIMPATATRSAAHPSYLDIYGTQPFLYFSAYKSQNGYNRYYDQTNFPYSDCAGASPSTNGVWPYAESFGTANAPIPRYLNPNSFQIISAGGDKVFGVGTIIAQGPPKKPFLGAPTWTPQTAGNIAAGGRDDQSNFYDALLGTARD